MNVLPVTALAAVAALATSTGTASAGIRAFHAVASEHLYVAGYANQQLEVQRFPFVNGFPSRTPDLTYQNVTTPIAVGRNGTFYATVPLSCCYGLGMIDVFAPNSNVVARQITLPNLHEDTTIDTALVEGPRAYLYVGYAAFISGDARGATRARSKASPCIRRALTAAAARCGCSTSHATTAVPRRWRSIG